MQHLFNEGMETDFVDRKHDVYETTETGHGRTDERKTWESLLDISNHPPTPRRWLRNRKDRSTARLSTPARIWPWRGQPLDLCLSIDHDERALSEVETNLWRWEECQPTGIP